MQQETTKLLDHRGHPIESGRASATYNMRELEVIIARESGMYGSHASHPFAQVATVYSCVSQIANAFAQIPWGLWRSSPSAVGRHRGYIEVLENKLLDRMRQPNDIQDEFAFKEAWVTYLLTGGNVWMYMDDPDSSGVPRALMLFNRSHVSPIRERAFTPLLGWQLKVGNRKPITVGLDQMLHWHLPNDWDDVIGLAPTEAAKAQIDADYAESLFEAQFYQNSASPSGILTHKAGPLDPDQRKDVRESFEEVYAGPTNAGKIVVLGSDFDFKVWGAVQSQTQFYESKTLNREEISAAFWGFPVVLLNSEKSSGLNRSELEAARLILYENCVIPQTARMTPSFNSKFIRAIDPRLSMYFEPDLVPVVLMAHTKAKAAILSECIKSGLPLNAIVQLLDLNLAPVEGGDVGYLPGNYVPLSDLASGKGQVPAFTVPVDESKPPKKESLPIPKKSILEPLILRAKRKIKRVLYDLRREAMSDGLPCPALRESWIRLLLPIAAGAIHAGFERGHGDKTWLEDDGVDIDKQLAALQGDCLKIEFGIPELHSACEAHMRRMLTVYDSLASAAFRDGANAHLDAIDRMADALSVRFVTWAYNSGAFLPSKAGKCLVASHKVPAEARYPGDPSIGVADMWDCTCNLELQVASTQLPIIASDFQKDSV